MLEVYTWQPNANSGKPLFCLHEKQVPFTYHYVDMGKREHFAPEFLAINRDGTIPAVVHDGFVMTESTPIMEYIDDAFDGPALRPADPFWRWRMRQVMRVIDNQVAPSLAMLASNRLAAPGFRTVEAEEKQRELAKIPLPERRAAWERLMYDSTDPADLAESARRVTASFTRFDTLLAQTPWLAGQDFSLADICVFATFYGLPLSYPEEVNPDATPHLWGWLQRCHARPGLQRGFAMGSGFFAQRVRDVRETLGLAAAAPA
jgi:glutathione S-transferase/GST-like protein